MAATPPLLRTSERNDFKRCPWLWTQTWQGGLTPRREPTWAWFGTAIHAGLEARYPKGRTRGSVTDMLDAFDESLEGEIRKIYTAGGEIEDEEAVDARTLGHKMLMGYVEEFGKDSEWEVIHTEQSFQIDVPHPDKDKILAVYAGTWDLLIYNIRTGEYWLVDHKTRKSFPGDWSFYDLNDQAGSYLWVAPQVLKHLGVFKGDEVIEGIIFNALRKHLPDERPRDEEGRVRNKPKKDHYIEALQNAGIEPPSGRVGLATLEALASQHALVVLGEVSARQPAPLFHREEIYRTDIERVTQGQRVQAEAMWMDKVRKGKLPAFKTPTEDCVRCKIFDLCVAHESNPEESEELSKHLYMKRDPYASHREDMERTDGVIL